MRINDFIENQAHTTRNAFSGKVGIASSNIGKMLNGIQPITRKTIHKIAVAYNLNEDWLLSGDGDMYASSKIEEQLPGSYDEAAEYTVPYGQNPSAMLSTRLVDEIADTRKLLAEQLREHNKQFDRLLTIIEKLQK